MPCSEYEELILEYCEETLPRGDRLRVEGHVADCEDCRAFLAGQQALEARLRASIAAPRLSPEFDRAFWRRTALDRAGELLDYAACAAAALAVAFLFRQHLPWLLMAITVAYSAWEGVRVFRESD
jgi:anti-sigma factor RsiW